MHQRKSQPENQFDKGPLQERRAFLQLLMGSAALVSLTGLAGCSDTTTTPDSSSSSSSSISSSSSK